MEKDRNRYRLQFPKQTQKSNRLAKKYIKLVNIFTKRFFVLLNSFR